MTANNLTQYKKVIGNPDYPTRDSNMIDMLQPVAASPIEPFSYDPDTTSGLTLGYFGGQLLVDGVLTSIAAGTLALTASSTNYVEATRAGVISKNTTAFTAGSLPLYTAVTTGSAISSLTDVRGYNQPHHARLALATTGGTTTLTYAQARVQAIDVSGTLVSNATIEVPAAPWSWIINNGTTGAYTLTVKVSGQTGVTVYQGKRRLVVCDGTDARDMTGYLPIEGGTILGALILASTLTLAADPVSAMQPATKQYVDSVASGLDIHPSCRAATTTNIASLAGGAPNVLDGVTLAANDRILVKDQSTGSQNGLYYVSTLGTGSNGTWTRASDADATGEVSAGLFVWVNEGTLAGDTGWVLTTNDTITIGSTSLTFQQFTGVGQLSVTAPLVKTAPNSLSVSAATTSASGVAELADNTETAAGTDTARAVTPAGLAAAACYQGKRSIYLPAAALRPRVTNGCGTLATTTGASNQPDIDYLPFDGAAAEYAKAVIRMPTDWNASTLTAKFDWRRASGTGAANVVWGIRAVCVADNESPAANFGTGATVTDAASTTTANFNLSSETSACTVAGTPAAGELMFLEVYRDGASGSDSLDAVDAWLSGVVLYYTTNAKVET